MRMAKDAALILIDVQEGFNDPRWGARNNPQAEEHMARLLAEWRRVGRPVIHVQHDSVVPGSPLRPGQPGNQIKAVVAPRAGEPVFHKTVNSAFIGTGLEKYLRERGLKTLVIVGLTTPHCVSTTARMAGNLGFEAYVVSDATAAYELKGPDGKPRSPENIHDISLATLHGEFATVVTSAELLGLAAGKSS